MRLLVDAPYSASTTAVNNAGKTPGALAKEAGHNEVWLLAEAFTPASTAAAALAAAGAESVRPGKERRPHTVNLSGALDLPMRAISKARASLRLSDGTSPRLLEDDDAL